MFGVERLNNIEEDKKAKVKLLTSEILVTIHDKPGSKKIKTYLVFSPVRNEAQKERK